MSVLTLLNQYEENLLKEFEENLSRIPSNTNLNKNHYGY